jgi:hypothetical protein
MVSAEVLTTVNAPLAQRHREFGAYSFAHQTIHDLFDASPPNC